MYIAMILIDRTKSLFISLNQLTAFENKYHNIVVTDASCNSTRPIQIFNPIATIQFILLIFIFIIYRSTTVKTLTAQSATAVVAPLAIMKPFISGHTIAADCEERLTLTLPSFGTDHYQECNYVPNLIFRQHLE